MKTLILGMVAFLGCQTTQSQQLELTVPTGHSGVISAMAVSPNNKYLATGASDGEIKIWEVETGRELRTLSINDGEPSGIWDPTFSENGKLLGCSSESGIIVWDFTTGKVFRKIPSNGKIRFIKNDTEIVSGGDEQMTRWQVATGTLLTTYQPSYRAAGGMRSFDVFKDHSKIIVGCGDRTIRLFDLETGKELKEIYANSRSFSGLQLSEDNSWATYSEHRQIKFIDVKTWDVFKSIDTEGYYQDLALINKDKELVFTGNGVIKIMSGNSA